MKEPNQASYDCREHKEPGILSGSSFETGIYAHGITAFRADRLTQRWKQEFGALTAATWTENDLKNLKAIYDSLPPVFGPAGSEVRKANDIFQLEPALSNSGIAALPYFYLDSGTKDPF
jgi:hypothetical protein